MNQTSPNDEKYQYYISNDGFACIHCIYKCENGPPKKDDLMSELSKPNTHLKS
jgi:hypothetical protein